MPAWNPTRFWRTTKEKPEHLRRGRLGEEAARRHLEQLGLKCLAANVKSGRGEIDLVLSDGSCLVFAEVKTRSQETWVRPAEAVNKKKQRLLSRAALGYVRRLKNPYVPIRFDIVEVLLEGDHVRDIRHLPNAFPLSAPYRFG